MVIHATWRGAQRCGSSCPQQLVAIRLSSLQLQVPLPSLQVLHAPTQPPAATQAQHWQQAGLRAGARAQQHQAAQPSGRLAQRRVQVSCRCMQDLWERLLGPTCSTAVLYSTVTACYGSFAHTGCALVQYCAVRMHAAARPTGARRRPAGRCGQPLVSLPTRLLLPCRHRCCPVVLELR